MSERVWAWRAILAAAGVYGAVGVAAAAAASHGENARNIAAIAAIALSNGPALLALALAGRGRMLSVAATILAIGTAVFIGDLAMREWLGQGLFPGAAPLGGVAMIGGWLAIVLAAVTGRAGRL